MTWGWLNNVRFFIFLIIFCNCINTLTISLNLSITSTEPSPPAAAPPPNGWSGRLVHRWADCGRCQRGSWWCIPHCTGCCRSYCRPPAPPCPCASPPQTWSAWAMRPSAGTFKFSLSANGEWNSSVHADPAGETAYLLHSPSTVHIQVKVLRDL